MSLTITDLDRMQQDERWAGWGYIMERRNATPERREAADSIVLEVANAENLTYDQLFMWANSKKGRWFMDTVDSTTVSVEDVQFKNLLPSKRPVL